MEEFKQILDSFERNIQSNPDFAHDYYMIMHDYKDRGTDSLTTLEKLFSIIETKEIVKENVDKCINKMSRSIGSITAVRQKIISFAPTKEMKTKFSKILALHFEGLVASKHMCEFFSRVEMENEEKQENLTKLVHQYSWLVENGKTEFYRSISDGHSIISLLPTEFYVSRIRSIPEELQFLALCGFLIDDSERIKSLVKCLKLYGSQVITAKAATEWMTSINEYIGKVFIEVACSCEPFVLHPGTVMETTSKFFSNSQVNWVFGEKLNIEISQSQPLKFVSPIESVRFRGQVDMEEKEHTSAAPQIAEMKCNQFYLNIKNTSKALQGNTKCTPIPAIVSALYGENVPPTPSNEKKERLAGAIIDHCFFYGKESELVYDEYVERQESLTQPTKPFWRALYKSFISKSTVMRRLVLTGMPKKPSDVCFKKALAVIKEIADQVDGIKEAHDALMSFISTSVKGKPRYCCATAACATFYIFELARMIEKSGVDVQPNELASVVLKEEPPYREYGENNLCNADIPVKHVMGCIGTLKGKPVAQIYGKDIFTLLSSGEHFVFAAESKNENIKIRPIINPSVTK